MMQHHFYYPYTGQRTPHSANLTTLWRMLGIALLGLWLLIAFFPNIAHANTTQAKATSQHVTLTLAEKQWIKDHPRVVAAASSDWPPFDFVNTSDQHVGIIPDYLNLIARKTGLGIEYKVDEWNNSVQNIKSRRIDIIGGLSKTPEREQFLSFTKPILLMSNYFFIHKDVEATSIADLNGKRLAIPKGYAGINVIQEHFPDIIIVETKSLNDAIDAVLERRADILFDYFAVLQFSLNQEGINSIVPFKSTRFIGEKPMFLASRSDAPELASIMAKGLAAISSEERQHIQKKWFSQHTRQAYSGIQFTAEEKAWLKQNKVIPYGAERDWPPFDFTNKKGEHQGVSKDMLDLVGRKIGITFSPEVDTWNNLLKRTKSGELKLLPAINQDSSREAYLDFTPAYAATTPYLYTRSDFEFDSGNDFNGKRIAVPQNYAFIDTIKNEYPALEIIEVNDIMSAMSAVLNNRADFLVESHASMQFLMHEKGITSIQAWKPLSENLSKSIHMAVPKTEPLFSSILYKTLDAIPLAEKKAIFQKWIDQKPLPQTVQLNLSPAEKRWLRENPVVTYGAEKEWAPFDFVDKHGRHQGIARSFLDEISKQTGITFKAEIADWDTLLTQINHEKIDLLPAIFFLPSRKANMNFTLPYAASTPYFYTRQTLAESQDFSNNSKLTGRTVAITKGYAFISILKEQYPGIIIKETDGLEEAVSLVMQRQADFVVDSQAALSYYFKKNGIRSLVAVKPISQEITNEIYMATSKAKPELAQIINKVLMAMPASEKQAILNYWLGATTNDLKIRLMLTAEENDWLSAHKTIRFAGDPNWLPFEGFDKQGNYVGMVADYMALIEKHLGITFDVVQTDSWHDTLTLYQSGKVDVIAETIDSSIAKNNMTTGYISNPIVILMNDKEHYIDSLTSLHDKKVGVIKEYGYIGKIKRDNPQIEFVEVDTIQSGLLSVSTGELDAMLSTVGNATYQISEMGLNNIRIVGKTNYTTALGFAVSPEYTPLIPILNKVLNQIDPKEKKRIQDSWGKQRFASKIDYSLVWKILAVFATISMIAWLWIRRLRQEIELRKHSEHTLEQLNQRFKMATDAVSLGVWELVIPATKLIKPTIIFDDKMCELFDFDPLEDITWEKYRAKIHPDDLTLIDAIRDQIMRGEPIDKHYEFRAIIQGETRYIYASARYDELNNDTKDRKLIGVNWDISHIKHTEIALEEAKQQAEQANRAKSEFLANMSHEIRTPMNSIIGFTELLDEQVKEKRLKAFIKTIRSAGNSLLGLINDILDLSKIEAGKLRISHTACNPHELFNDISNIFSLRVREKNLDLLLEVDPNIPESLLMDEARVRQILFNLIGNAVKFTETGHIKIRAYTQNTDDIRSKLDLIIDVEDTGIGISESQQALVFQAFEQSRGMDTRKYGGTGLGLSISSRLAHMMNGSITLRSQLGQGATFSLNLLEVNVASVSQQFSDSSSADVHTERVFRKGSILVTDDIQDNRDLILANFADTNITITTAENGQEAVDLAQNQHFDMIFMDIRMPVMDGYEAAERIKSFSTTPVVALTASVMMDEFDRLKSNNFDGYLRKPVLRNDLFDEVSRFIAFDTVEVADDSTDALLSAKEIEHCHAILPNLQQLIPHCEYISQTNNLSLITDFAKSIDELIKDNPITPLQQFTAELKADLDSFNIAGIKKALGNFSDLIKNLETQSSSSSSEDE